MKMYSTIEIKSVLNPPIKLNFVEYINCPICEIELDVKDNIIDSNSFIICENCEHIMKYRVIKI